MRKIATKNTCHRRYLVTHSNGDKTILKLVQSVHTQLAVNLDKALLGILGVVYCSGEADSFLSLEAGSLRFLLRVVASCSGVGTTCFDRMASFFSNIFVAKPASFTPYP